MVEDEQMAARIGYVRTVVASQRETDLVPALCDRIVRENQEKADRLPVLRKLMRTLSSGDQLVVPRIDELGTSLQEILTNIIEINDAGIVLLSVDEDIDTGDEAGPNILALFRNLARINHDLMSERIRAGQSAAKNNGKRLGRPRALDKDRKIDAVNAVLKDGEAPAAVAVRFGIHPRTVYRIVEEARAAVAFHKSGKRQNPR
jgi:DNA invertase Pin-like site-specific DNA recombinase